MKTHKQKQFEAFATRQSEPCPTRWSVAGILRESLRMLDDIPSLSGDTYYEVSTRPGVLTVTERKKPEWAGHQVTWRSPVRFIMK